MRRKRKKASIVSRITLIMKKSRLLFITVTGLISNYHRRHYLCIEQQYRCKNARRSVVYKLEKTGKLLRNRKHHIASYKITRNDLDWLLMRSSRSPNDLWRRSRIQYFKVKRNAERLHPNHIENMLLDNWWRI